MGPRKAAAPVQAPVQQAAATASQAPTVQQANSTRGTPIVTQLQYTAPGSSPEVQEGRSR
jgi:hypothetical protein